MYSKKEIFTSLKEININKGDSLYLSTSFGMLGYPSFKFSNIEELSKIFFDTILNIIGPEGTIFTPTFSYSFSKKKDNLKNIFNLNKTKSQVGPFGEYIRRHKNSIRSKDPMVSITGYGKMASILTNQMNTSYGEGCMFEKLAQIKNLKILNIGVGANYIPFIHYVDYKAKCEHRFNKYFFGYIVKNRSTEFIKWHYPVAYKKNWAIADGHKLAKKAMNKIIYKKILGEGNIYCSDYNKLLKFCLKEAKINPWITAVGKYEKKTD